MKSDYNIELVRESLLALVNEMRANMIYASYSSIIYEGHDFSCCLMAGDGRQVSLGRDDHPIHMFAVPTSMKAVLERFSGDIAPGDVFLHNDPYTGGTHLNDILMLYPIFADGQLCFFAAVRAHWNDVGGMTPGSISGQVTEIYQEGVQIPPIKIAEKGRLNAHLLEVLIANMRIPAERKGDFNCMLGVCRKAEANLAGLVRRFGKTGLTTAVDTIIARSEAAMRRQIEALPDGEYFAEGYVESNGHTPEPLVIRLRLEISGSRLIADFSGSSPQTRGPTNVGPAMAWNSVFTVVKSFLDAHVPVNHGAFAPIEVIAPVGSFINARSPAPCGGMAECKFGMDSVVCAALAQAVPGKSVGDLKGTGNHIHIAGRHGQSGEQFILYEYPAGGTGALMGLDGNNTCRAYSEGDFNSIQSVEVIECSLPLRIEHCAIRQDSCGHGRNRGGFGMVREVLFLSDTGSLSVLSDRNVIPPYGVGGGESSLPNSFLVLRDGDVLQPSAIPGKVSGFAIRRHDTVRIATAGGGGFGDPLDRDLDAVLTDVLDGYITVEAAQEHYGAVVRDRQIDRQASQSRRNSCLSQRERLRLILAEDEIFDGTKRLAMISDDYAATHGIRAGEILELVPEVGASLRVWAAPGASIKPGTMVLGPSAFSILRRKAGDTAFIRRLQ